MNVNIAPTRVKIQHYLWKVPIGKPMDIRSAEDYKTYFAGLWPFTVPIAIEIYPNSGVIVRNMRTSQIEFNLHDIEKAHMLYGLLHIFKTEITGLV